MIQKQETPHALSAGSSPSEALLDTWPTANGAVRTEQRGDTLVLWVPLRRPWWLHGALGWLLPLRSEKGVALDALGQEVWRDCNGQRRLEDIIEDFAARHRIRFHEARLCVLSFLRSLIERNLVVLAVPEEALSGSHQRSQESKEAP